MRVFTSVYWLGGEAERTVIRATTVREAIESHYECGWNAFDERRLVVGDVSLESVREHRELVVNESWGEEP